MGKLFDPNRRVENSYLMRLSQTIADQRGAFVVLCVAMLFWFAVGAYALRNQHVGDTNQTASPGFDRSIWTTDDTIFWGAVAGATITLGAGLGWFHAQMKEAEKEDAQIGQDLTSEIARFKQESQQSARADRLQRLQAARREAGAKPKDSKDEP
ncbi:MAG: hypothetical protein ACREJ2_16200 [Planctomycetota bacterium]